MPVQLEPEVYKWLTDIDAISRTKKTTMNSEGKFVLDTEVSTSLETGLAFPKIIRYVKNHINQEKKLPLVTPPNMKQLKEMNNPAAKLYNWNIITDSLSKFGYNVEPDIKSLIIAGDVDMIAEILRDLFMMTRARARRLSTDGSIREPGTPSSINSIHEVADNLINAKIQKGKGGSYAALQKNKGSNLPEPRIFKSVTSQKSEKPDVDGETTIGETTSTTGFFIVSLAKNLSLTPKQAAALLAGGNKYLAHVVIKGVKGDFEPIVLWYQDVYANINHLMSLLVKEESPEAVTNVLQVLKPGLMSKEEEVAQAAIKLYLKLAIDLLSLDLMAPAAEWFFCENGGLFACLVCIKRHPETVENITTMMVQFGASNMFDLFTAEMEKHLTDPLEYLNHVKLILRPLTDSEYSKEELLANSVVDYWLESAFKIFESHAKGSTSTAILNSALILACEIWELYPQHVAHNDKIATQILSALKRAIRDKSRILKTVGLTLLFRLLETFAAERNNYAPIIYKTLTFCFIENYSDLETREYIIHNFCAAFDRFQSIPVDIIVEPLIKELQIMEASTSTLNLFDFKLFNYIASHNKLTLKNGIQLLDSLAKIYLNVITFAHCCKTAMTRLISRFAEEESMQEYLEKLGKICMGMYQVGLKKKKPKEMHLKNLVYLQEKDQLFSGTNAITPEVEQGILNSQKCALIIELLKAIINENSQTLNNRLKPLLVTAHRQIKQNNRTDDKGTRYLLGLLGDPDDIIREFEKENSADARNKEQGRQSHKLPKAENNVITIEDSGQKIAAAGLESATTTMHNKENRRYMEPVETSTSNLQSKELLLQNFMDNQTQRSEKEAFEFLKSQNSKIGIKASKKKKGLDSFWSDKEMSGINTSEAHGMKAHLKALEKLDEIQKKNEEKKIEAHFLEEQKKKKEERTKLALKKAIEERRIELGVGGKVAGFDEKELVVKSTSHKQIAESTSTDNRIYLVYLDLDEDFQREAVNSLLKHHTKAFRFLFGKYNTSVKSITKVKSVDATELKQYKINIVETWKMLKDNGFKEYVSKDEMIELMRLVNKEIMHSQDFKTLDYEGFVKFLFQLSVFMYSRPPVDLSHMPYAEQLRELIAQLKTTAKDRGEYKMMFEDTNVDGLSEDDKMRLKEFNERINSEPNLTLPAGFKKVMDNNVNLVPEPSNKLNVPEKYTICYDIVNEMLKSALGVTLYEPFGSYATKFRVVPAPLNLPPKVNRRPPRLEEGTNPETHHTNSGARSVSRLEVQNRGRDFDRAGNKSVEPQKDLNEPLKEIAEQTKASGEPAKDPKQQSGGRKTSVPRSGGVINRAIEERMRKEMEEKLKEEQAEKRRQQRLQELEKEKQILKEKKKETEAAKALEAQNEAARKEQEEKQREEARKKELEKKKELVKQFKDKKQEETQKQLEAERERKKEQELHKKKEVEQFIGNQKKKFAQQFDAIKKGREEEEKQKVNKEHIEKKKEEEHKKKMEMLLEKERERRNVERKFNEVLVTIQNSEPFQHVFKKYGKTLKHVFDYYKEDPASKVLPFSGFMHFASQLNIFPALLNSEELNLIFRSLTREKTGEVGLLYDEYLQSLLRITIKGKNTLNKVYHKYKHQIAQQTKVEQHEMKKMIIDERKGQGEQYNEEQEQLMKETMNFAENVVDNNKDDVYGRIEEAKPETLEALIFYLDLPNDKKELAEKLKGLRKENAKILAPRDKKRAIAKKGLDDSFEGPSKQKTPKPTSKSPRRDFSSKMLIKPLEKEEKLEAVSVNELTEQPDARMEVIRNPEGNIENWQVRDGTD